MTFKKKAAAAVEAAAAPQQQQQPQQEERLKVKGLYAYKPHDKAPDFIMCDVTLNEKDFEQFLKDAAHLFRMHEKYGRQLRLQLKESKDGSYYFAVNTFTPQV